MKKLIYQVILVFICSVTSFFSYSQDMGDAKLLNSSEDWKGFSFSLSAQAYTSIFDINNRENSARLGFFSLRSRAYITKRFLAKAEVFLHPEDRTNLMRIPEHINRQFSFGWMSEAGVGIGFGMENGDRYFGTGHEHDSTWHNLRFRAPGQTNYKFVQDLYVRQFGNIYHLSLNVGMNYLTESSWKDTQLRNPRNTESMHYVDFEWRLLFAPKMQYDHFAMVQPPYAEEAVMYESNDLKRSKFGTSFLVHVKMPSRIILNFELGLKPGLKNRWADYKMFTNIFLMAGVGYGLDAFY
jgi:hypothetical protein